MNTADRDIPLRVLRILRQHEVGLRMHPSIGQPCPILQLVSAAGHQDLVHEPWVAEYPWADRPITEMRELLSKRGMRLDWVPAEGSWELAVVPAGIELPSRRNCITTLNLQEFERERLPERKSAIEVDL